MVKKTEEYHLLVKVLVEGKEKIEDAEFDKAAQAATADLENLLHHRDLDTSGCKVTFRVETPTE